MDLAGLSYDWYDSEDYDDPDVYELLRSGETTDIFQMASYNATKMLGDFRVSNIEGVTAVNAGNRPGPLEKDKVTGKSMVDLYVERKAVNSIPSIDPRIDSILKETMGCIYYQEQCMELGKVMAGYDLGGADSRIRAPLGKKKTYMFPEIKNEFIYGKASIYNEKHEVIGLSEEPSPYCTGTLAHGFSLDISNKIFGVMEDFAKYSFNKAHAFCYATIAYKTAYLSKYYPVEFAIANCTVNDEEAKIVSTLSLAKKRKIDIFAPDINNSDIGFSPEIQGTDKCIRYGLKAIKGIGPAVLDFLKEYRQLTNVVFKDFDDYYNKIHDSNDPVIIQLIDKIRMRTGKNSNNPMKKDVEKAFILAGAFDYCEPNRYKLLNHYLIDIKKDKTVTINKVEYQLPLDEKTYNRKAKLALEKEYMGAYISEHPLDMFPYEDFDSANDNQEIKSTFIAVSATLKDTKKGRKFLSIRATDKNDIERTINVFDEAKALDLKNNIKKNSIIIVQGRISKMYNNVSANSVKIAISKKQIVDTEDIDIQDKTGQRPSFIPVAKEDPLSDIFGTSL